MSLHGLSTQIRWVTKSRLSTQECLLGRCWDVCGKSVTSYSCFCVPVAASQNEFTTELKPLQSLREGPGVAVLWACSSQAAAWMCEANEPPKAIEDNGETMRWTNRTTETTCHETQPSSCRQAALEENQGLCLWPGLGNHARWEASATAVLVKVSRQNLKWYTTSTKSGCIHQPFCLLPPLFSLSYIFLFNVSKTDLEFLASGMLLKTAYSEKLTFHKYNHL